MNNYERIKVIKELIKQGKTYNQIKIETGCCNSTISKYKNQQEVTNDK